MVNKLRKACSKYMLEKAFPDPECSAPKRRISLPSPDSLLSKLSQEYFLYILQNLQFSKHLDTIIGDSVDRNTTNGISPRVRLAMSLWSWSTCLLLEFSTIFAPPFICHTSSKLLNSTVDEWGIWVDFEIRYEGLIKLILETKLNLMKLKEQNDSIESPTRNIGAVPFATSALRSTPSRYSDEEIPESPETSPDEEFGSKVKREDHGNVKKKTGKKILNFVDKITQSKYFKEATELKPIRKMMEEISSTRLI
uniref:Uncharacterized protein n=1 Tax=Ditylenchus dipsaci TaxID=166011 RepID=A0A915EPT0_9BILA